MSTSKHICRESAELCGCCEGVEPLTPRPTANRPGLSALGYRVGTHATFLETMQARLSSHRLYDREAGVDGKGARPLAAITTRDTSDPSLALLDAWATIGDVLTFYQERIANEAYLRTATERRSVLELARLVGYRPRPGVAASTYLAYTIDENMTEPVQIPAGARVQSVPGPDELPQSFETSEALEARSDWNRLTLRRTRPQQLSDISSTGRLYLEGIVTGLKPGEPLLVGDGVGEPDLFRVLAMHADADFERTNVDLERWDSVVEAPNTTVGVLAHVKQLIESAPQGVTADRFVEHLNALRNIASTAATHTELSDFLDRETLPQLDALFAQISGPAPRLRAWMTTNRSILTEARETLAVDASTVNADIAPFSSRLNELNKKPSSPLSNSLQLPRSLEAAFRSTSDAGLKLLTLASPELDKSLVAALESYTANSPALEVFALRLKTGVFGRNAPKRQMTVRRNIGGDEDFGLETVPIGEWPVVVRNTHINADDVNESVFNYTESSNTIFLDNSYEGILPGSWIVVDTGGVPVFGSENVQVEPTVFPKDGLAADERVVPSYLLTKVGKVVGKLSRAEYGMSGESTQLDVSKAWIRMKRLNGPDNNGPLQSTIDRDFQTIRGTTIYARSEPLALAEVPVVDEVCDGVSEGALLELDGLYRELEPGRFVIVSGERSDIKGSTGVQASEVAMISEVLHDVKEWDADLSNGAVGPLNDESVDLDDMGDGVSALPGDSVHTYIRLHKPLSYCYRRDSVMIYGNVVKASHGETHVETLGNGNGAEALQSFSLKQKPLTHLAAPTAFGAESTLQVLVNDVRWHEQRSVVDESPTAHVFVTHADDQETMTLTFGNGREGARLPTGIGNVKALYRNGLGSSGNVRAEQLSLLSTRPQGVKEVINPIRASGGADRERRDQIRRNAPLGVAALERLVSTQDYADFARGFAGIAKADAVELSDGQRGLVHVAIAGMDDNPIDVGSDLYRNLRRALIELGDPFQPVRLAIRELLLLVISASVSIDPDFRWESVVTDVRARLLEQLGFENRELGMPANSSEVLSIIQSTRGVVYVDLDAFGALPTSIVDPGAEDGRRPLTPGETAVAMATIVGQAPVPRVVVKPARIDAHAIRSAQIAILAPKVPETLILNQIRTAVPS